MSNRIDKQLADKDGAFDAETFGFGVCAPKTPHLGTNRRNPAYPGCHLDRRGASVQFCGLCGDMRRQSLCLIYSADDVG